LVGFLDEIYVKVNDLKFICKVQPVS
jgi:hypothetical protein